MVSFSLARAIGLVVPFLAAAHASLHMEHMGKVPSGWTEQGLANDSTQLSFHIGLQLGNLDQLYSKLMDVSTPGSPEYGQYLDRSDVDDLFAPSAEASGSVMQWLSYHNITSASLNGHWINFTTNVATANDLLSANYRVFVDGKGTQKIRTKDYSIPADVAQHIDMIEPATYLGTALAKAVMSQHGLSPVNALSKREQPVPGLHSTNCSAAITPACLRNMYNVGNYTPDVSCGSRIAFASFLGEVTNQADLLSFQTQLGKTPVNIITDIFNGGIDNEMFETGAFEANLDSEYMIAMSYPLPVTQFVAGGSSSGLAAPDFNPATDHNEPWAVFARHLLSRTNAEIPQVISLSYGDDEQTVPKSYATRVCTMFGMLGLRGISILGSAGDSGVGTACRTNDGLNSTRFIPEFPSTCPYVIAVGGTQAYAPEEAWTASGGGFSDYFDQPAYQHDTVNSWLRDFDPTREAQFAQYANYTGRAYPDLAAHSDGPEYVVISGNGTSIMMGGTSAAAPVVAGIIGLLNDARLRAGKPVMGFLNPWLYSGAGKDGLTDIMTGASGGCDGIDHHSNKTVTGAGIIPGAGWNATRGWDPVTGFGVPDFGKMKELALSL